jgi:hypothetical protein
MADVTVRIVDMGGSINKIAKLPGDAPMSRLMPALVTKLNLPAGNYKAMHKETGKELGPTDTLSGAGVLDNHTIRVMTDMTGG